MNRGMLTRTGQPSMHLGFLHCRHRSASSIARCSVKPRLTSVERVRAPVGVVLGHRDPLDGHPLARVERDVLTREDAADDVLDVRGGLRVRHRAASASARAESTARAGIRQASRLAIASCSKDR